MTTKLKDANKKRVVRKRKPKYNNKVSELLEEKGLSEKWLADELEKRFGIKKAKTSDIVGNYDFLSIQLRFQFCMVLGVAYKYFEDIPF